MAQTASPTPAANPAFMKGTFDSRSEGADIIGAVFLSIEPKLDKSRAVNVSKVLKTACDAHAMATLFVCGKDEEKYNKTLEKNLKQKGNKHQFIGAYPLDTKLSGVKLLTKGLKTDEPIKEYLGNVIDDRKNEWMEREFDKSIFMWRMPGAAGGTLAKDRKMKTLVFEDYSKLIPQQ